MVTPGSTETREKLALVWAERRERLIAVKISYDVYEDGGCTVYSLNRLEEQDRPLLAA